MSNQQNQNEQKQNQNHQDQSVKNETKEKRGYGDKKLEGPNHPST